MAKKATRKSPGKRKRKASPLKDQAYKVWLAGLGALSVAEAEGSKLFNQLVEKGADLEKRGKPVVDRLVKQASDKAADVRKKAEDRAGKVGGEAKETWSKVESAVDAKVTAALHRMGIPTRKEIEALSKRVETLTAKLDARSAKKASRKSARKPAKKSARKPAKKAAKKTSRKPAKKATSASAPAVAETA